MSSGTVPYSLYHRFGGTPALKLALFILIGALALTLASRIAVPMVPVPITAQTLAVTSIGALYGPRLGALTVMIWLALGAAGLPVFAGGAGGYERFLGATAGYLFAFPIAAAVTGALVARGWNHQRKGLAFAAMLLGNFVCLSIGAIWLATQIGAASAFTNGFTPFLVGAVIKSALGVLVIMLSAPR